MFISFGGSFFNVVTDSKVTLGTGLVKKSFFVTDSAAEFMSLCPSYFSIPDIFFISIIREFGD